MERGAAGREGEGPERGQRDARRVDVGHGGSDLREERCAGRRGRGARIKT